MISYTTLETYKGKEIVESDGEIAIHDLEKGSFFFMGLDDSKDSGERVSVEEGNTIERARQYIDWVTKK